MLGLTYNLIGEFINSNNERIMFYAQYNIDTHNFEAGDLVDGKINVRYTEPHKVGAGFYNVLGLLCAHIFEDGYKSIY